MIELVDTVPEINVQPAEYKRLLGYPRDFALDGRARELADDARAWYAAHGRPWIYARQSTSLNFDNGSVRIDGHSFHSKRLQSTLQKPSAESVVLVAVSAGPEVEAEAQRLWLEEKPDEYFFLEIYGSALVEHLVTLIGSKLCNWAERNAMAVLPHYSPGYRDWDISEQNALLELMRAAASQPLPSAMEVLESGMLRPKKSLLAVFGLTRQTENVRRLSELVPCENCSLPKCSYRRSPYARAPESSRREAPWGQAEVTPEEPDDLPAAPALTRDAKYLTSVKALRRWATDRLKLTDQPDGGIHAVFHYEGSTCSNMGRAIRFDYAVTLSSRSEGYRIVQMSCSPTPGDDGFTRMCRYMNNAEHLMVAIDHEKPLLGEPLNDVLTFQRPAMAPSCLCEPNSRKHKWAVVLETIHVALVEREKSA